MIICKLCFNTFTQTGGWLSKKINFWFFSYTKIQKMFIFYKCSKWNGTFYCFSCTDMPVYIHFFVEHYLLNSIFLNFIPFFLPIHVHVQWFGLDRSCTIYHIQAESPMNIKYCDEKCKRIWRSLKMAHPQNSTCTCIYIPVYHNTLTMDVNWSDNDLLLKSS